MKEGRTLYGMAFGAVLWILSLFGLVITLGLVDVSIPAVDSVLTSWLEIAAGATSLVRQGLSYAITAWPIALIVAGIYMLIPRVRRILH